MYMLTLFSQHASLQSGLHFIPQPQRAVDTHKLPSCVIVCIHFSQIALHTLGQCWTTLKLGSMYYWVCVSVLQDVLNIVTVLTCSGLPPFIEKTWFTQKCN